MSAPLISGSAALVRQWLQEERGIVNPDGATIKALLLAGAKSLAPGQYGTGAKQEIPYQYPNNVEGWGQANIGNTVANAKGVVVYDGRVITQGEEQIFTVNLKETGAVVFLMTYADALEAAKSDDTKIVDLRHADTEGKNLEVYEEQATGNVYLWGSAGANRVFWLTGVSQGSDSNGSNATFSGSRAAGNATLAGVMSTVVKGDVICLPAGCYYVGSVVSISKSCMLTGWLGGEGTTLHKSSGHSQKNQHLLNCSFRTAADLEEAGTVDLVGLNLTTTKDHICAENNGSNIACRRCAAVQAIGHVTVNVYDVEIRNFPMAAFSVNAANSIVDYAITGKNAKLNWYGLRTYDNFCTASIFALPRSDQGDVAAAAVTQAIFNYDENCTFADADLAHPFHLEDPPKRVPGLGNCIVNGYSLLEYQEGTDGTVKGGFYAADPTASGKLAPCYVANYKENYEFGGFVQNGWLVEQDTDACQAKIVHEDGSVTYYATFADAVKGATSGGTVSANRGIAATEEVIIANKSVTLDLAGHTLTGTRSDRATIFVKGCLTIDDSAGGGRITHAGEVAYSGHTASSASAIANNGELVLLGGVICDCEGDGATVANYGRFYMSGGSISNCTGTVCGGVQNYGDFVMAGGAIEDCRGRCELRVLPDCGLWPPCLCLRHSPKRFPVQRVHFHRGLNCYFLYGNQTQLL